VRLEQVQGRAVRICSHKDLPQAERTVDVFTYIMKFSEQQKRDRKVDESISVRDKGLTTDQIIYTLMMTKRRLSEQMFDIMKSSAIDCLLNALEHGSKSCFMITSGGAGFLYNPDYREDLKEAQSQYRFADAPAGAVEAAAVTAAVPEERAPVVAAATEASEPPGLAGAGNLGLAEAEARAGNLGLAEAEARAGNLGAEAPVEGELPEATELLEAPAEPAERNLAAAQTNLVRNEGRLNARPANVNANAPNLALEGKNDE
jgi:hypothetical protein